MGDLQIHKTEIVQQVSGEQRSPQEVLNSTIEKQRQFVIEGIKQDLLKNGVSQKKIETLKFDIVGNIGVIINSKGKLAYLYKYGKNTGVEFYTSVDSVFTDEDLDYASRDSGYQVKNGKLFKNGQEILQFLGKLKVNPEFVKGIDNLNFYQDIQLIYGGIKTIESNGKLKEVDINTIYTSIISGVVRIKDIMYFAGKGFIPNDDIPRLLKRAVQELPNQCSDTRFYQTAQGVRMGMEVTKDELDEYLYPTEGSPIITQKMYDDCLRRIEARDRKIQEEQRIKEGTRGEIKVEKTRKGFSDKVIDVLTGIF